MILGQQTNSSPQDGTSHFHLTVAEAVEYHLEHGGAVAARTVVSGLAATFSFKDEWPQVYRWALSRIEAFEAAERSKSEELQQQQMDKMMLSMMAMARQQTSPAEGKSKTEFPQCTVDLSDRHICWSLTRLMEERMANGKLLFDQQNHWQAVFRILSDFHLYADDDFDYFDSLMQRVMPAHVNSPYLRQSVKNISQTPFNKPFEKWKFDIDLLKKRAPYDRMVQIATRFKELLESAEY